METQSSIAKRGQSPTPTTPKFSVDIWPNGWMDQDATWHEGRRQLRRLCVRWGPSPLPKKEAGPGAEPPIFGPCLLWPNGWMDQDGTWHGGRPQPGDLVLDRDPAPSPKRGRSGRALSPIFGPFLLWPNGWMHQDATWYGGRPRPRRLRAR